MKLLKELKLLKLLLLGKEVITRFMRLQKDV